MKKHVLRGELIGCNIEVVEADNKQLEGIKGRIIDETKNTITINDGKHKMLLKNQIRFIMEIDGKRLKIDGKKINKRPEKRI